MKLTELDRTELEQFIAHLEVAGLTPLQLRHLIRLPELTKAWVAGLDTTPFLDQFAPIPQRTLQGIYDQRHFPVTVHDHTWEFTEFTLLFVKESGIISKPGYLSGMQGTTVGDLLEHSRRELANIPGVGTLTLQRVLIELASVGLRLSNHVPGQPGFVRLGQRWIRTDRALRKPVTHVTTQDWLAGTMIAGGMQDLETAMKLVGDPGFEARVDAYLRTDPRARRLFDGNILPEAVLLHRLNTIDSLMQVVKGNFDAAQQKMAR